MGTGNRANGSDIAAGQQIVRNFLFGLRGSNYYKTNTSYGTASGSFHVVGQYTDGYSQGTRLSDSRVQSVLSHAISCGLAGRLMRDFCEIVGITFRVVRNFAQDRSQGGRVAS